MVALEKYQNWKYDVVHFVLSGLYLILFLICFTIVVRLVSKGNWNLRWQKFFHPVLMLGCLIRATFFILQPFLMENVIKVSNQTNVVLNTFPSFLFFSNYLIILFLWAEIYHYAHDASRVGIERLKPIFLIMTLSMYSVVALLYALDYLIYKRDYKSVAWTTNLIEGCIYIFGVSIYAFTSIGFILYGIGIRFKVSSMPVYTTTRRQVLRKVQTISMLVSLAFITRSAIIALGVFYNLSSYWWFDGVYFSVLELVPLVMMLNILHGDSRKTAKVVNSKSVGSFLLEKETETTTLLSNA